MGNSKSIEQYKFDQINFEQSVAMLRRSIFDPEILLQGETGLDDLTKAHKLA